MGKEKRLWFLAFLAPVLLAGCVIPGSGLDGAGGAVSGQDLMVVPRRTNYGIFSDPFYPRADLQVYRYRKDGSMVAVPVQELDSVGIIDSPEGDPDVADAVSDWLQPVSGSYTFQAVGRFDVVVVCGGVTAGRYSVWVQDPLGIGSGGDGGGGGGGGGGSGGGIGIEWGN
jgi:hypothetical protein